MHVAVKKFRRGSFLMQCTTECNLPFMQKLLSGMTIHKKSYDPMIHALHTMQRLHYLQKYMSMN